MKKTVFFFCLIALVIILGSCTNNANNNEPRDEEHEVDKAIWINDTVTVAEVVEWLNEDTFSVEAAAEWDSANADGGYLPIRCAERYLDTIINHYHVVFIPEP